MKKDWTLQTCIKCPISKYIHIHRHIYNYIKIAFYAFKEIYDLGLHYNVTCYRTIVI